MMREKLGEMFSELTWTLSSGMIGDNLVCNHVWRRDIQPLTNKQNACTKCGLIATRYGQKDSGSGI